MARRLYSVDISNFRACRRLRFTPPPKGIVQLVGPNESGKSSALDAMQGTLKGCRSSQVPGEVRGLGGANRKPLTDGELRGSCTLDLGDIIVERSMTEANADKGGTLRIKAVDGEKRIQDDLDLMFGPGSFDPLELTRLDASKFVKVLQSLAGEEFTSALAKLDADIAQAEADRTAANRELKRYGTQPAPGPEPVVLQVAEVMAGLDLIRSFNADQARRASAIQRAALQVEVAEGAVKRAAKRVSELEAALEEARGEMIRASEKAEHECELRDALPKPEEEKSTTDLEAQIAEAGRTQRAHEEWRKATERALAWSERANEANEAERKVRDLRDERVKLARTAKLPIEGLAWTSEGATLDGYPIEELSSSRRLRLCVKLAVALHPELRLWLIREGSLLDNGAFAELLEMAEEEEAQVIVEVVGSIDPETGEMLGAKQGGMVIEMRAGVGAEQFEKGKDF